MSAREKFAVGNRVTLSAYGRTQFPKYGDAAVVGFHQENQNMVLVRRDGKRGSERFHEVFWEVTHEVTPASREAWRTISQRLDEWNQRHNRIKTN